MIKGIPVILHVKTEGDADEFGRPTYTDEAVTVENVLVTPGTGADEISETNLSGKTIAYTLCIPKGDNHIWTDTEVEFYGEKFRTVGYPQEYIEELLPLSWNKKVKVERYD